MGRKFILRVNEYDEKMLNLSSLKLKDNELLVVDDEESFEHKLHRMLEQKFNGDKTDVIVLDIHEHKIGLATDNLFRIIENTALEVDHNGDVRGFIVKLLRALNTKDASFLSFLKYYPYFQKDSVIHLLFDRYNLDDFVYRQNLIVYGDKTLLTSLTLSRYLNITYTNLTDNSKEGFLYYKDRIEVKKQD